MMNLLSRSSAVTAAVAVIAAGTLAVAPGASAAVTGGTTTLTVSSSYAASTGTAGVLVAPSAGASLTYDSGSGNLRYQFPVTGGDANVDNFTGTVQHQGSLVFVDYKTKKSVTVSNIQVDFINNAVTGQLPGTATQVALFDLDGFGSSTSSATAQSYTASALDLDAAGAAALDSALGTTAFVAGATVGSFATSYTTSA